MKVKILLLSKFYLYRKKLTDLIFNDADCKAGEPYNKLKIELNNSSAFVDIDGDCINDLILSSYDQTSKKRFIEIWRGKIVKTDDKILLKYCLKQNSIYEISNDIGNFSIADIDRDGMLDLIFPLLNTDLKVLIAYNKIKYVFNWDGDYCLNNSKNEFNDIFIGFSSKTSDNNVIDKKTTEKYDYHNDKNFIVNLYDEVNEKFYINEKYGIHPIIRTGDINTDSYPDLIVTSFKGDVRKTKVFINTKQETNVDQTNDSRDVRNFIWEPELFNLNNTNSNEVYSSFFDLDENGQLDILVVLEEDSKFKIQGYFNNYHYDAFFLKSLNMLTSQKYSTYAIGVTYRYIATNLNGSRRLDVNYQALQLNSMSLSLPYTFIGIGRSNNYIENFHVISPTFNKNGNSYKIFTPIIPNSQLLISENKSDDELKWSLDLIVNPTNMLILIIGVIVIILVLLLLLIVYLHCQELKEDQVNDNMIFTTWFN